MACSSCGQKNKAQKFLYTSPSGEQVLYTSEVQAQAAKIRNGGGSYVAVAG